MKCAKCDYVSFDYLSECKNCHASMEAARAGLRFPAAKPTVMSLLGPLISSPAAAVEHPPATAQSPTSDASSLEHETGIFFDEGFQIDSATSGERVSAIDESNEDFSLLDISDEELGTLLDEDDVLGKGQREDNLSPGQSRDSLSSDLTLSEHVDTSAELELDLGDCIETKDWMIAPDVALQAEPEKLNSATGSQSPEAQALAGSEDDFILELPEEDLDNFFKQLEQTTGGKT